MSLWKTKNEAKGRYMAMFFDDPDIPKTNFPTMGKILSTVFRLIDILYWSGGELCLVDRKPSGEAMKNIREFLRYIKNNPGKEITDIGQILGAVGIKEDK